VNEVAPCAIRAAEPEDADQVTALLGELGYPGSTVEAVRRRLAVWEDARDSVTLVAENVSGIIGLAAVSVVPYLERDGHWGRISALVVTASCRGQGIGRMLMAAAEELARDCGCVVMEVTSDRSRIDAAALYRSHGYEDWCGHSARFVKDLAAGASQNAYAARLPVTGTP
jgi:GNAT superfamily N-acetyltransferase